jgi:prepilin-type N-terminal cleavage/methylation domain-containing protein
MHRLVRRIGFTLTEVLLVVVVLGIIAGLSVLSYGTWQQKTAGNVVKSDIQQAVGGLKAHRNFKNGYPPNLAGTGFATSPTVALTLFTNAPSVGVYQGLSSSENAQLFLNSCNANIFGTPNNTACQFQGSGGAKIHVKGTSGTNAIWNSPIQQSGLTLSCGSQQAACDQALAGMISQFTAQGGVFPITVPGSNVPLPAPTLVPNGLADRYCLEGRSATYPEVAFHFLSQTDTMATGKCPADSSLRYYP